MTEVQKTIWSSIKGLLELGVNFRLHRYLFDKHSAEWRNLSAPLHADYPVKSLSIIATRTNIEGSHFLQKEELVAPEDIVCGVVDPVYDAAMAAYAFTMVELCGDEVAALVRQAPMKQRAWHTENKQNENLSVKDALSQATKFAQPFDGDVNSLTAMSVIRLARMKAACNQFAHDGVTATDCNQFLEDALAVLVQIYYLCLPRETHLQIYPWQVLNDKWEMAIWSIRKNQNNGSDDVRAD